MNKNTNTEHDRVMNDLEAKLKEIIKGTLITLEESDTLKSKYPGMGLEHLDIIHERLSRQFRKFHDNTLKGRKLTDEHCVTFFKSLKKE